MLRTVLGLIAGIAVAALTIFLIEGAGHAIWPPPPETDLGNPESIAALMDDIPTMAKVAVLTAWFLGALAGAVTALKITHVRWTAWATALAVILGGVVTMFQIPHPTWMMALGVVLPLLAAWAALHLVSARGQARSAE